MSRLTLSVFIAFIALLLGACGLTERERAVTAVNQRIRTVEESSHTVADAIAALPDGEVTAEDFSGVRAALAGYMEHMEALNGAIRVLGDHYEALQTHLTESFRPSAEAAAVSCQNALDALGSAASTQDDFRGAVTRIGQCLERYATAVTNVSAAHRLAH